MIASRPVHAMGETPEQNKSLLTGPDAPPLRRAGLGAAIYFAMIVLVLLGDVLIGSGDRVPCDWPSDMQMQIVPWLRFGFDEIGRGNLPLWNPHILCGTPFFGNGTSALLYPPNYLNLILPTGAAVNWSYAFHIWLAGWLTWAWCRMRGVSMPGSLLAGTIFACSGPVFHQIYPGHLPYVAVIAWAPGVMWCVEGIARATRFRQAMRWGLLGMLFVSMEILAGAMQGTYYTAIAAGIFALTHVGRRARTWRALAGVGVIYAGAALLTAVQLGAIAFAASESIRASGLSEEFAGSLSLPPENFVTMIAPFVLGDDKSVPYFGAGIPSEMNAFCGVVGLAMAVWACIRLKGRARWSLLIPLLAAVVFALGAHTPLFAVMFRLVPGYNSFRAPTRFLFIVALFIAILAGTGFDLLRVGRAVRLKRLYVVGVIVTGIWGCAYLWSVQHKSAPNIEKQWIYAAATGAMLAIVVAFKEQFRGRAIFAIVVLGVAEMLISAGHSRRVKPTVVAIPDAWKHYLSELREDERTFVMSPNFLNLPMVIGRDGMFGHDPMLGRRIHDFLFYTQRQTPDPTMNWPAMQQVPRIYAMLRTSSAIWDGPPRDGVRIEQPMPHLSLVSNVIVKTTEQEQIAALADESFDPRRTVILESEPPITPGPLSDESSVTIESSSTDHLQISAQIKSPTILLVTDAYSAGWRAIALPDSSQRDYTIMPANFVLQAIPLSTGTHHFVLEYTPRPFRIARIVSIVALIGYAFACTLCFYWGSRDAPSQK